ncbi:MAG TPA: hypothetical protein LFV90_01965 [Rickettsia endosymbiont of Columbicola hoogstraali]|nr:hypothetical protein [Rickettsia endosymbiont of Columbicola hoogstraali]
MYAEEENENYEQKSSIILEFLEKNVKFTLEEILEKNSANKAISECISNMSIEKQKQLTDLINSEFCSELKYIIGKKLEEYADFGTEVKEFTEADVSNIYKRLLVILMVI